MGRLHFLGAIPIWRYERLHEILDRSSRWSTRWRFFLTPPAGRNVEFALRAEERRLKVIIAGAGGCPPGSVIASNYHPPGDWVPIMTPPGGS